MKPRGMLVEFIGLPGVGKSEVSRRVALQLGAGGVRARQPSHYLSHDLGRTTRRIWKLAHVLRELATHPLQSWRTLRAIAATQQRDLAVHLSVALNWLLVVALTRRAKRREGMHVFDQGIVQAIWSVALEGDAEKAIALLAEHAAELPDVVVLVEADLATVQARLVRRPDHDSRLDREKGRAPELLQHGNDLLHRIATALEHMGARIIPLRNEAGADAERLADQVVRSLLELQHADAAARDPAFGSVLGTSPQAASVTPAARSPR